jgi:hypothetical protein
MRLKHYLLYLFFFFATFLSAQETIWPGDVNNNGVVNEIDLLYIGLGFGETGPARKSVSSDWAGQTTAIVWATSFAEGLNLAYADCNGDGVVDKNDADVVKQNFGLSHADVVFQPDSFLVGMPGEHPAFTAQNEDLTIFPNTTTTDIQIALGDSLMGIDDLLGLSFHIKADPTYFDLESAQFTFSDQGWLPNTNANILQHAISSNNAPSNDLVIAYSKTNRLPASGNGLIGQISIKTNFVVEGDVPDLKITIDSITLIDKNHNKVPVVGTEINFQTDRFQDITTIDTSICAGSSFSFKNNPITTSGTYQDTLTNALGGDSIIIVNLQVDEVIQTRLDSNICQGDPMFFNGQDLLVAGVYLDTLTSLSGCDSLIELNLNVLDNSETILERSICSGENFIFNNQTLITQGTYLDTLTAANGCNRYIILNLEVLDTSQTILNRSICAGEDFSFNGQKLTTAGTYRDTLVAANGCSQFVVLHLAINETASTTLNQSICAGESYQFNQETLTESGTYQQQLSAADGCDSIIMLHLEVLDKNETMLTQSICEGASFSFNDQELNTAGIFRDTLTNVNGCDSFIILNLAITDKYETVLNEQICAGGSRLFNGQNLTDAGSYEAMYSAANGCDSLVILNLAIRPAVSSVIDQNICKGDQYSFNGQDLDSEGVYFDTLSSVHGCDSFIQLNLNLLESFETNIERSICKGDTLHFHGFALTTANTYMVNLNTKSGCDSMIILDLQLAEPTQTTIDSVLCPGESMDFHGNQLSEAGAYTATLTSATGCDSLINLNLSIADSCVKVSVEDPLLKTIAIYPNPARDYLWIHSPTLPIHNIQLFNLTGQLLIQKSYLKGNHPDSESIDLQEMLPGVYWVLIQTEVGIRKEKIIRL